MKAQTITGSILAVVLLLICGCGTGVGDEFIGSGTLEADEVIVSSLLAGRVDSVAVSQGDSVEDGELLALINVDKIEAQLRQITAGLEELAVNRSIASRSVEQAEEQFNNLSSTLDRQQKLLESGSSTQQIVDDLSTQQTLAESRLEAARDQLKAIDAKQRQVEASMELIELQIADGAIHSPVAGTVIEKYIDAGENAAPGSPIAKIVNLDEMWIKVYLSEEDVGILTLGSKLTVRVDALPDKPFDGEVSWVSPEAEFTPRNIQTRDARADLVFAVKVKFDNPDHTALIGMPAEVALP